MIDFSGLYRAIDATPLKPWCASLPPFFEQADFSRHGDLPRLMAVLEALPPVKSDHLDLGASIVTVGGEGECSAAQRQRIEAELKKLHPWRKGPFSIHGVYIDTEWRSDWKWDRVAPHITPLHGRRVLDVGCGSGYHCWRAAGDGARLVIGIEPTVLYNIQFHAVRHFMASPPEVFMIPARLEQLPELIPAFDTVFSMGVLYHRRSPFDHLFELKSCLVPGGELVLETLVIDGGRGEVLVPDDRYAKMGNVWFIPSPATLEVWLRKAGFKDIRLVDVGKTTTDEQRRTEWMTFESLSNFLYPGNTNMTIEGHPAPRRAIFVARNG
ncbi:MAG: tRNA 5-methoxyuridine(34)/uridine 5-oxyacetic acid(34) synthase CmoB [Pseudomonadota bacterium]